MGSILNMKSNEKRIRDKESDILNKKKKVAKLLNQAMNQQYAVNLMKAKRTSEENTGKKITIDGVEQDVIITYRHLDKTVKDEANGEEITYEVKFPVKFCGQKCDENYRKLKVYSAKDF